MIASMPECVAHFLGIGNATRKRSGFGGQNAFLLGISQVFSMPMEMKSFRQDGQDLPDAGNRAATVTDREGRIQSGRTQKSQGI
jgi:hypothetical protein